MVPSPRLGGAPPPDVSARSPIISDARIRRFVETFFASLRRGHPTWETLVTGTARIRHQRRSHRRVRSLDREELLEALGEPDISKLDYDPTRIRITRTKQNAEIGLLVTHTLTTAGKTSSFWVQFSVEAHSNGLRVAYMSVEEVAVPPTASTKLVHALPHP